MNNIAVWAEARNGLGDYVIGDSAKPSGLPWPKDDADLRHFAEVTAGRILIMGRSTFNFLPSNMKTREATRERPIVVLTSLPHWVHQETSGRSVQGIPWVHSEDQAADLLAEAPHWFENPNGCAVIGGTQVIELFAPVLDQLILSRVKGVYPMADTLAPSVSAFTGFMSTSSELLSSGTTAVTFTKENQ